MEIAVGNSGTDVGRPDTSQGHEVELHAGRQHPGDAARIMFLYCTPQVDTAVKALCEALDQNGADRDPDSIATLTKAMITPLRQISYREYQELVGMVDLSRDRSGVSFIEELNKLINKADDNLACTSAYKAVLSNLKKVFDLRAGEGNYLAVAPEENALAVHETDPDGKFNRDFADQTMLLVRTIYPLGVNVLSPDWLGPEEGLSFSASKEKFGFWLVPRDPANAEQVIYNEEERQRRINELNESGGVVVRPAGERSKITFYAPGAGLDSSDLPEAYLEDGEAIVIGRVLQINSLYGMDFFQDGLDPVKVETGLTMNSKDNRWSRGGVMLARMNGRIYLFDRGSKWSIANPDQSGAIATYTGRSIVTDIGELSYGCQTRVEGSRLPEEKDYSKTVQAVLLPDDQEM